MYETLFLMPGGITTGASLFANGVCFLCLCVCDLTQIRRSWLKTTTAHQIIFSIHFNNRLRADHLHPISYSLKTIRRKCCAKVKRILFNNSSRHMVGCTLISILWGLVNKSTISENISWDTCIFFSLYTYAHNRFLNVV